MRGQLKSGGAGCSSENGSAPRQSWRWGVSLNTFAGDRQSALRLIHPMLLAPSIILGKLHSVEAA
jgi:hypothetical protein